MRLNQASQTILFGANSEIGNQILKATHVGLSYPRYFFGRTVPGSEFRDKDIFIKFDAIDLDSTEAILSNLLESTDIGCAIISFASMDYSNQRQRRNSNTINYNATVHLIEILLGYFAAREKRTSNFGTIIYISSSIVDLKPRQKNFRYSASKVAAEYYFKGLRDQVKKSGSRTKMILVKPGFTKTKLHLGERPGPFATTAERLSLSIKRSMGLNIQTIYAPMLIKIPILALSKLPSRMLNILDRRD